MVTGESRKYKTSSHGKNLPRYFFPERLNFDLSLQKSATLRVLYFEYFYEMIPRAVCLLKYIVITCRKSRKNRGTLSLWYFCGLFGLRNE